MKIRASTIIITVTYYAGQFSQAQGTFQNLDFESANLPSIASGSYGGEVSIGSALPGWNASINGTAVTEVLQNNYTLGAASIDVFGPDWSSVDPGMIDGNYSVFLQVFTPSQGDVSLWQDGTIPANAQSLQFKAWSQYATANFSVSFGGNSLMPVVLSSGISASGQPYNVYGVNINQYAGQTGQLEFTALPDNPPGNVELDDITFSAMAIPEPNTLALMLTGGAVLALRQFRRKRP